MSKNLEKMKSLGFRIDFKGEFVYIKRLTKNGGWEVYAQVTPDKLRRVIHNILHKGFTKR